MRLKLIFYSLKFNRSAETTNLAHSLGVKTPDKGNLRETFFANQLSYNHLLTIPKNGDFMTPDGLTFEIGGINKDNRQLIKGSVQNGFIAADDIEFGNANIIPLWMFGFQY